MIKLNTLSPKSGARRKKKRLGRGSGTGKGHKGQNSRSGGGVRAGFEGGQMPLQRRLPKRGFKNIFALRVAEVSLADLDRSFEEGGVVDKAALSKMGLIKGRFDVVKILCNGELTKKLKVRVDRISKNAKVKIESLGGVLEELER